MPITTWTLDASAGELLVQTGVTGRAAKLGHKLTLAMTKWEVTVSSDGDTPIAATLTVDVSSLIVVRGSGGVKGLSGPEKALARSNALGALDAKHHPTITFRTDTIDSTERGYRLALDHAGDVMPDDRRERHQICVVSATDLIVERVDGGRMNAHPYLAGSDLRYRDVAQLECVGPSETGEHDGLHRISHIGVPHRGSGFATRRDAAALSQCHAHDP